VRGGRHGLALSVDLDEWYHSRRWVDGEQARAVPDTKALFRRLYGSERPGGEIVRPTLDLLDLFDRHTCRSTFFVLGEVASYYPDLVREIAARGHEIACHGYYHVDMTVLGPEGLARQLDDAQELLWNLTGRRPLGYRAPNLVYAPWATEVLEERGFVYDATVCASRPLGGKYRGWSRAPLHPYHPSYEDVARPGSARLVEVPLPSFPVLRIAAGSGIITRVFGFYWTFFALRAAARRGNTSFYLHPWEIGHRPRTEGHGLRNAVFLRRVGPWMVRSLERLLRHFEGRTLTTLASAATAAEQPLTERVAA
jgi:peptidoglycan/xylan/chitin deacetylase (PgdA/CDA1 family)